MPWMLLALLANTLFSLTNIFDKFFNSKKIKSVYSFAFLLNAVYFVFVLFITYLFRNTFSFGIPAIYAAVAGAVWFFMWIFFWKAMQTGEASRVSAIFFSQPIFSAFIAIFFLNEKLNGLKWIGIIMIVAGAILSSWEAKTGKFTIKKAYIYALIAAILSAVGNAISKYAMNGLPSLTVNSIAFYATIPMYFFFLKDRKVFDEVKKNIFDRKVMTQFAFRGLIGYGGIVAFMLSLGSGPYSLVSAISGTQPLFVLAISIIFSILAPKVIHEEISRKSLAEKSFGIVLIVAGAIVISIF